MNLDTLQKVTVKSVDLSDDKTTWEIVVIQTHTKEALPEYEVKLIIPVDLMAWRVAEYGLDSGDLDTLIDIMICERYLPPQEMQPNTVPLWNAPTIEEARSKYLQLITNTKLKYRISTREKDSPLGRVKQMTPEMHPADIGLKALGVIMHRHRSNVQKLDPDVFRAITHLEKAAAMHDGSQGKGNSTSVDKKGR
jgi:hypothetical protein